MKSGKLSYQFCGLGLIFLTAVTVLMIYSNGSPKYYAKFQALYNKYIIRHTVRAQDATEAVLAQLRKVLSTSSASKNFVTVKAGWLCGDARLGNKMFMIAAGFSSAMSNNSTFVMPLSDTCPWIESLIDYFPILGEAPQLNSSETDLWKESIEMGDQFTSYVKINVNQNVSIIGYRQSYLYFNSTDVANAMRILFTFSPKTMNHARAALSKALTAAGLSYPSKSLVVIGVHVRVGDLLTVRNYAIGYTIAKPPFYVKAFNHYQNKYGPDVVFVTLSDSINISKILIKEASLSHKVVYVHEDEQTDMAVLRLCDHTIMSGGTYGFWGSWLANGDVVYFSGYAKPGSLLSVGFHNEFFYPSSWVPMI